MQIQAKIYFKEAYLPTPRCRKYRYREATESVPAEILNVTKEDAPVAFIVHDSELFTDGKLVNTEIRTVNDNLYKKVLLHDVVCCTGSEESRKHARDPYSVEEFLERIKNNTAHFLYYASKAFPEREEAINALEEYLADYAIIDNELWRKTGEPRYYVVTFGLGHNHASTALMISNYYNSNIPWEMYFSAFDRQKAIDTAIEVALRRGDTNSVPSLKTLDENIEVLMPEMVRLNPKEWGCPGDEFHNMLSGITERADSAMEAGLLTIVATMAEANRP